PDVQEMYGETAAIVERRSAKDPNPQGDGDDEEPARGEEPRTPRRVPQPPQRRYHAEPQRGGGPARLTDPVATGDPGAHSRSQIDQLEPQSRAGGDESRRAVPQRRQRERHDESRDGDSRDRYGD